MSDAAREDNQATEAAGTAEVTDSSTTEDSTNLDFDSDDIFDDIDTSDAPVVEDEAEDEETAATESEDEAETEAEADETTEDDSEESEPDETAETTEKSKEEVARETFLAREEARKARAEADAVRKKAEEDNIQRYLDAAKDDEDLLKQRETDVKEWRLQQREYALNERTLQDQVTTALRNIDLFNSPVQDVREEMLNALDDFEARSVVKNEAGQVVEVRGDLLQHLQAKADSIRRLTGLRDERAQADKTKQKSRTLTAPVKTPKKAKTDPGLDAFDEEVNRYG